MTTETIATPVDAHPRLDTFLYTPPFDELGISVQKVERAMGYGGASAPEPVVEQIGGLLAEAPSHLHVQAGFRIVPADEVLVEKTRIQLLGQWFETGQIIARGLRKGVEMAIFTATCGPGLDAWSRAKFAEDDLLGGYLVDALGSETVECAADWLENQIRHHAEAREWAVTNRFSPGYCGWMVREQHALFALLPPAFCGITLTPTALMQPVKSVSGFYGLGPTARKLAYECKICTMTHCFRRNVRKL